MRKLRKFYGPRKNEGPTASGHRSERWNVQNSQGQCNSNSSGIRWRVGAFDSWDTWSGRTANWLQSPACQALAVTWTVRTNCTGGRSASFFEALFGPSIFGATSTCRSTCAQQTRVSDRANTGILASWRLGCQKGVRDQSLPAASCREKTWGFRGTFRKRLRMYST